MVSGWPIPAGGYYDYEFQLVSVRRYRPDHQEPGHFGTYWYHSHVGMQMHTSAGPIIIKEKNRTLSPVAWDEEAVMMLGDYYTVRCFGTSFLMTVGVGIEHDCGSSQSNFLSLARRSSGGSRQRQSVRQV